MDQSLIRWDTPVIEAFPNCTDKIYRTERDVVVTADPNDESGIVEMVAGNLSKASCNRPATASHTPGERD